MNPPRDQSIANGKQDSYYHPINQALRYAGFQKYQRASELGFGLASPPIFSTPEDAATFEGWHVQQQKIKAQAQEDAEEAQSQADLQALATTPKPPDFGLDFGRPTRFTDTVTPWRSNASGRPVAPVASAWGGPPAGILERIMRGQQSNRERLLSSSYIGRAFREGR